ncbi:MAG TPA: DMT family transporter [Gammaproteobacteria bacterium]|nr:DMT family transporter [Gammaproteobacteria bacterium]
MNGLNSAKTNKAFLILIIGSVLVGIAPVMAKLIDLPAVLLVFYRILLAFPLFILLKPFNRNALSKTNKSIPASRDMVLLMAAGILFALDMSAFYLSLKFTSVTTATLLGNFSPVFIAIGYLFSNKRVSQEMVWVLFALAGLIMLCGCKPAFTLMNLYGDLIALLSAFFFTGHILIVNKLGKNYSSIDIMFWSSIGGMFILLILCLIFKLNMHIGSYHNFLLLLFMAWGSQVIGQTCLTSSMSNFPPSFSSLGILLDPLAAAFFAFLILGESLSLYEKMGGVIILVSIFGAYKSVCLKSHSNQSA